MPLISDEDWPRLFAAPMRQVGDEEEPPFNFWPYVQAIPSEDFKGYDCSAGHVKYVYRHPSGRLEHVLINSNNEDVFMVIVVDRSTGTVVGHRLLDLPRLYGSEAGGPPVP